MISFSNRWNGDSHCWSYISASSQKNGGLSFKANCRNKSLLWKVLGRLMLTTYLSVFLLQTYMRIKCNRQSRLSGKFQNTSWPKEACPEIIWYLWRHSVGWLISKFIVRNNMQIISMNVDILNPVFWYCFDKKRFFIEYIRLRSEEKYKNCHLTLKVKIWR